MRVVQGQGQPTDRGTWSEYGPMPPVVGLLYTRISIPSAGETDFVPLDYKILNSQQKEGYFHKKKNSAFLYEAKHAESRG